MFINIYIKSKNINSLKYFLKYFLKLYLNNSFLNVYFLKSFSKKNLKKKITVLKSPHVNSKAGEYYVYNIYSKQINLYSFNLLKFLTFLKKLKINIFPDVSFKLIFFFNKSLIKTKKKKIFNPDLFKIKNNVDSKYLKLFDAFGETCFIIK
nr:ribosomal protein S10 [Stephanopyxis turris]